MKYTMGELAEIVDGDRGKNYPQQHEFQNDGYCLFLNTGNVTETGFSFEKEQEAEKEGTIVFLFIIFNCIVI